MRARLITICGPTGVGKSALAMQLASECEAEIVSCDSQVIYRGMTIGSDKPSVQDQRKIAHHMIDICDPDQLFNPVQYAQKADQVIAEILSRKRNVLVVGGTGLYFRALLEGLCDTPPQDPLVRERLELELKERGITSLYEELQRLDPVRAAQLSAQDTTRIVRALEVWHLSGRSIVSFWEDQKSGPLRYHALQIGITMDREMLYARINARVEEMMKRGLMEEVQALVDRYGVKAPGLRAVGYKECVDYLQGLYPIEECVRRIQQHSRHLAKRQWTWFRKNSGIEWFHCEKRREISDRISTFLKQ